MTVADVVETLTALWPNVPKEYHIQEQPEAWALREFVVAVADPTPQPITALDEPPSRWGPRIELVRVIVDSPPRRI